MHSQCTRRRLGLGFVAPAEHYFAPTGATLPPAPTYLVDNVITSGSTLKAARTALGGGVGLVFADATHLGLLERHPAAGPGPSPSSQVAGEVRAGAAPGGRVWAGKRAVAGLATRKTDRRFPRA